MYITELRDDAPNWVKKLDKQNKSAEYLADISGFVVWKVLVDQIVSIQPGHKDFWKMLWIMIEECIGDYCREYLPLPMVDDA